MIGLAGGHDPETRAGFVEQDTIEPVHADIVLRRRQPDVESARLLLHRRIGDVEAGVGVRAFGVTDVEIGDIKGNGGGTIDDIGHRLEADIATRPARHRPTVQAKLQQIVHVGGHEHGNGAGDQRRLALMRHGRGFAGMVVARDHQHAAGARGSRVVAVAKRIAGTIDAGAFAIPIGEHAVIAGGLEQRHLLRAPDGGGGNLLVHPGEEVDMALLQMLLGLPHLDVDLAKR